jgi:SAM-dependent methyltransferase
VGSRAAAVTNTARGPRQRPFPLDVVAHGSFPPPLGPLIEAVGPASMMPPYPWGQWLYGRVFTERCARLNGDMVEAGVGRGGMSIFLALLAEQLGLEKRVFAVDTFAGLPMPNVSKDGAYFTEGEYAPDAGEDALEAFWLRAAAAGVVKRIEPLAGLFDEVLPSVAKGRQLCFVHIDADLFDSVTVALECLYDSVTPGGVIAFDDFFHPAQGPHRATAEFFNSRGLLPLYHVVFPYSAFIIKEETGRHRRAVDGNAYSLEWLRGDDVFVSAIEGSINHAVDERSRANAMLLCETLRRPEPRYSDIYDYWRALEEFWDWIDVMPDERSPHAI